MTYRTLLFIIALICSYAIPAQSLTGSWYGKADVMVSGSSSNYLTEFVLKQRGDEVQGIFGYYFKDSYQTFFVRGSYDDKSRQVTIKNLPMLFYASPTRTGIECPMHFQGTLMVSKINSTIKGNFYTDSKYKYTCPELRVNLKMDVTETNQDSLLKSGIAGKKFWQPQEDDYVVSGYSLRTTDTTPSLAIKTVSAIGSPANVSEADVALINEFDKRKNIYEKDIMITNDSVLVSFYDNGDIDDDTISVFLNKRPVLTRRGLSSRALNIYIGLDSALEVNELSMFADNLGEFPPNTALMVISDGNKRYELYLSSSLKNNASVRLRRARKNY
jgi:hypothetical protein